LRYLVMKTDEGRFYPLFIGESRRTGWRSLPFLRGGLSHVSPD
jgi:hypothetical protein